MYYSALTAWTSRSCNALAIASIVLSSTACIPVTFCPRTIRSAGQRGFSLLELLVVMPGGNGEAADIGNW
jgi:hypothetical protein